MVDITFTEIAYQDIPFGQEVDMSETRTSQEGLYTPGMSTCYAVGIYGTTSAGVSQMLLCHADATMGDGNGAQVLNDCITAFGAVQEGTSLTTVVVAGSMPSNQYYEAAEAADAHFAPPEPDPAPVQGWGVDVAIHPGGVVKWAPVDWVGSGRTPPSQPS